jgi:hypothetical protein
VKDSIKIPRVPAELVTECESRALPLRQSALNCYIILLVRSRNSSVGIATGYGLVDRGVGVLVPVGSRIFSSSRRPDRLWGPPNLLSSGYPGGKAAGA